MYRHWQRRAFIVLRAEWKGMLRTWGSSRLPQSSSLARKHACHAPHLSAPTPRRGSKCTQARGGFAVGASETLVRSFNMGPRANTISVKVRKCRHRQGELASSACARALAPTRTHGYRTGAHRGAVLGRTCGGLSSTMKEDASFVCTLCGSAATQDS